MSLNLGKYGYKVYLDDGKYREGMRAMLGETKTQTSAMAGMWGKLIGAIGIGAAFWKSMTQAKAFSKELGNLKSIANDLDMSKIRKEILDLDARLGNSAELVNAVYFAYSAGVRGTEQELTRFTAQVASLAQTVGSGVTPIMDALTTMMNAYGFSVNDAGKLTDWFYQIVKSGKTSGSELAQSLGQIAATSAGAGISLEDLGAALATLTTTMPTNIAVTSLAASIRVLMNPTDETRKAAQALGIDMSAAAIRAKGFGAVMNEIYAKTEGRADIIAKLFPAESSRAIMALAGTQVKTLNETIKEFGNNSGIAARMFSDAISSTDSAKWDAMLVVAQKIGTALGDLMFKLLTLGGALNGVYEWIFKLNSATIQTIAKIGALSAGALALAKLAPKITSLSGAFVSLAVKGGYKTDDMRKQENDDNAEKLKTLTMQKEEAKRTALLEKNRLDQAKANLAAAQQYQTTVAQEQAAIMNKVKTEQQALIQKITAEQQIRIQQVQTAQSALVAEKTKELAVARSVATQMALEQQRHLFELKNRAQILPSLINQKTAEVEAAKLAGTLTKEQVTELAGLKKEYAGIGSTISKSYKQYETAVASAKKARLDEIQGVAAAQQKSTAAIAAAQKQASVTIDKANQSAQTAIARTASATQKPIANAAQGVAAATAKVNQARDGFLSAASAAATANKAVVAHNAAVQAGTVNVGLLRGAWGGLTAMIAANPIGFALTVATLAISGIMAVMDHLNGKIQETVDRASEASKQAQEELEKGDIGRSKDIDAVLRLQELSAKQKLTNAEMNEAQSLISRLQGSYQGFSAEVDTATGKVTVQAESIQELIDKMQKLRTEQAKKTAQTKDNELEAKKKKFQSDLTGGVWGKVADASLYLGSATLNPISMYLLNKRKDQKQNLNTLANDPKMMKQMLDNDFQRRTKITNLERLKDSGNITNEQEKELSTLKDRLLSDEQRKGMEELVKAYDEREKAAKEFQDAKNGKMDDKFQAALQAKIQTQESKAKQISDKWDADELTDDDRRAKQINQEFEDYKNALDARKALDKNYSDEQYKRDLENAERRKKIKLDENETERKIQNAMLQAQVEAYKDGEISDQEKLGLKRQEIAGYDAKIKDWQEQLNQSKSPEKKRKLEQQILQAEISRGKASGELEKMEDDQKYTNAEVNRRQEYESVKNQLSTDGALSAADQIELKRLEITQQIARIKELEEKTDKAKTEESRKQLALQRSQAIGKRQQLEHELKSAKEKKIADDAEFKRSQALLNLQNENRADGVLTSEEKKNEMELKIQHQRERVAELEEKVAREAKSGADESVRQQTQLALANAKVSLSGMVMEQKSLMPQMQMQGSFSAKLLNAQMTGTPIERQQLDKLRKIEKNTKGNKSQTATYK